MAFSHIPVLLNETLTGLNINPDGIYVDATFGRGGHSREILKRLSKNGRLYALDRDLSAIEAAKSIDDERFSIVHARFSQLKEVCEDFKILGKVNGILMDIGVSSPQLDDASRGFSFDKDGPLDMRMDRSAPLSAADIVNTYPEDKLAEIFKLYGEERFAKRAARAVAQARAQAPLERTRQLAQLLEKASPGAPGPKHKATRCFQALRIAVNGELDELQEALQGALEVLAPGGRLCVISFHSLEDRIVKVFYKEHSTLPQFVRDLPLTDQELQERYGAQVTLKVVGKAVKAGEEELSRNIRARSDTLRVAEKLGGAA